MYGLVAAELSSSCWPGHQILHAVGRVAVAEYQVKSAQKWVDGCHAIIAQGVSSPLDEAQAHFDRLNRNRETALEQLQQHGYRARFQS